MEHRTLHRLEESLALVAEDLHPSFQNFYQKLVYEKRASWHTVHAAFSDLKQFALFISKHKGAPLCLRDFETLPVVDLRAFLASRRQENISKRTTSRLLSSLKSFARFLQMGGFKISPAFNIITMPRLDKKLPRPLSQVQSLNLMERKASTWVELRDQALFMLLYGCGLRISEALNLNGEDWIPSGLLIKGKGAKERRVPLLMAIIERVEAYLKASPYPLTQGMPLFRGVRGGRLGPTMVEKTLRELRLELGLSETATPHALRHSCATHLLEGGGELRHIQELLGHASLSSTQIYTDLTQGKIYEEYCKAHPRMGVNDKPLNRRAT